MKLAVRFGDGMFVDARDAPAHQPIRVELPILIAISAKPVAAIIVVFVSKTNGDAIAREDP